MKKKLPSVSNLVKKTDSDTKISELEKKLTDHKHDGYITTPKFNKLTAENFAARLPQNITSTKTKHLLVWNELKKLKTFDLGCFIGKNHFDEDGAQNYLVFQTILEYFTLNSNWITKWNSKGLSNEILEAVSTSDNTLTPSVSYYKDKAKLKFTGSVLQQKTVTYSHLKKKNFMWLTK